MKCFGEILRISSKHFMVNKEEKLKLNEIKALVQMTLHALLVFGQPVQARPPQLDGEGHGLERHDISGPLTQSMKIF